MIASCPELLESIDIFLEVTFRRELILRFLSLMKSLSWMNHFELSWIALISDIKLDYWLHKYAGDYLK